MIKNPVIETIDALIERWELLKYDNYTLFIKDLKKIKNQILRDKT